MEHEDELEVGFCEGGDVRISWWMAHLNEIFHVAKKRLPLPCKGRNPHRRRNKERHRAHPGETSGAPISTVSILFRRAVQGASRFQVSLSRRWRESNTV